MSGDAGRVALVSGAARGIGAATVDSLVGRGWRIVAVDGPVDDLPYPVASADELDARFAGVDAVTTTVGDVRSLDDCRAAAALAFEAHGRLDALVAAHGVMVGGSPAWATPDDHWQAAFDVNVAGVSNLLRSVVPSLLEAPLPRTGRLVALASAAAGRAHDRLAAYSASKAAVVALMRACAADLRGTGVTANCVSPGSTRGVMLDRSAELYGLASPEEFAVHHLTGRLLEPTEVAAVVAQLCSADASAVTGAVIPADGGMTA